MIGYYPVENEAICGKCNLRVVGYINDAWTIATALMTPHLIGYVQKPENEADASILNEFLLLKIKFL